MFKQIKFIITILVILLCHPVLTAQVWYSVKGGTNGVVLSLRSIENKLYVGGAFTFAGGLDNIVSPEAIYATNIAIWDGFSWDSIKNSKYVGAGVESIEKFNNQIYIGGSFNNITTGSNLLMFNGINWSVVGGNGTPNGYVKGLQEYKGKLIIGGGFNYIGGTNFKHICSWDGNSFNNMNGGVYNNGTVCYALEKYNDHLVVGGGFGHAGDTTAFGVALWDGQNWTPLDTGVSGNVYAITIDTINNFLYVAGLISYAGGNYDMKRVYNVARWDGFEWSAVGNDSIGLFYNAVLSLTMYRNKLFASGVTTAWLPTDTIIASWDGKSWQRIDGPETDIAALCVYNDELYAGGNFHKMADSVMFNIARYYEPPDTSCNYLQAVLYPHNQTYYLSDSLQIPFYNNNAYASSWQWDFGDGKTDSVQKPLHTFYNPGTYDLNVIVNYQNCVDTAFSQITIKPCDSLHAFVHLDTDTLLYSPLYPSTVSMYSNANADYYTWYFGDGTSGTGFSNNHTYDTAGVYQVMVIVSYGNCIDTGYATQVIMNTAAVHETQTEDIFLEQNIPNPFKNSTIIPYYLPFGSNGSIAISDVSGKVLKNYPLQQGKNNLDVSLQEFTKGTYLYSIRINGELKQTLKMLME